MANDNQASYAKIGFTVLVGIVAIICTLIYLGGMHGKGNETLAETYYEKGVSGLSVGSVVNLRGVKVGEVRDISFVGFEYPEVQGHDGARICIRMALTDRLTGGDTELLPMLVANGLKATIASSGITGLSRIELDFYADETNGIEKLAWQPKHTYIPSKIGLMDNFTVSATKVMNQINQMDLSTAWSNVSSAVESLSLATSSLKMMLEARQGNLEKIVDDASETMNSLKVLSAELRHNPSLLIRERRRRVLEETQGR